MRSVLNNKVIFSYCRVSTSEQTTLNKSGLANQKHINDQAIDSLMQDGTYERLADVVEVGSAFKGANLNAILNNAKAGKYPDGSIVVMFDQTRFSRSDFFDATIKMKEIVESGLSIHFSTTNQTVGVELLQDFGGFIGLIAQAKAANDESRSRSNRTIASYNKKIANNEIVAVGALPNWLKKVYDTTGTKPKIIGFELIPERVKVIKTMFEKYISGQGTTTICKWLNENVEPWTEFDNHRKDQNNRVWRESYITKLLVNPALIGIRVFNIGKENEIRRDGYYPEALDKTLWYKAQEIRSNRSVGTTGGYKYATSIFSGITYCGYCGSKMVAQNFNTGRRSSIRCSAYAKNEVSKNICAGGSSASRNLDQVIIEFCSDKINFDSIFSSQATDIIELKMNADLLANELNILDSNLTKLEDLYFEDLLTKERYISRKSKFDEDHKLKSEELKQLNYQIEKNTHCETTDEQNFKELLNSLHNNELSEENRLKIRDLLPTFIDKIVVYRYSSGWVSNNELAEYEKLIGDKDDAVIEAFKKRTAKDKEARRVISYGLYFKSGFYRIVNFDSKNETWTASDNEGNFGITLSD